MKIGFVPIDNRPVCYQLPKQITDIDESIELLMPPKEFLGDLKKYADRKNILLWLENLGQVDALILSLDTIVYGGLIPSRRCTFSEKELFIFLDNLKNILKKQTTQIYAFSSIMRISNNNINEEEKEYWSKYGEKIFKYSYDISKHKKTTCDIPKEILNDYLTTRKRNFEINKLYLEWQKENIFNTLIFSKDDCAEYGFNVDEAKELESMGGYIKTGADEIPLTLLARAISESVKIAPVFVEDEYKNLISNYEDISVYDSVKGQIELSGCKITNINNADIILYINNFKNKQGEIVMKVNTEPFSSGWETPSKPYMIADIRFANGADNYFVKELLKTDFNSNFYGYSAWNTTANTLGSLICAAKIKFLAKKYNKNNFKKLQITRFLDDWAYQANVRQQNTNDLKNEMKSYEQIIFNKFDLYANIRYNLPWKRKFEVEIEFI